MGAAMKKCKVCGCEYEYCHTVRRVSGVFRWQDVACSLEHGSIYLSRIESSRAEQVALNDAIDSNGEPDYTIGLIEDEDDELFEKDFDDEAEEIAIEK